MPSPRGGPAAAPDLRAGQNRRDGLDDHGSNAELGTLLERVAPGWTPVVWDGRRYGLRRTDAAGGGAVAVVAEELGGQDLVSANIYRTEHGHLLRPCEMPAARVLDFLRGWQHPTGNGVRPAHAVPGRRRRLPP